MTETKDAPPVVASTEEKKGTPGNIVSRGPVVPVKFEPAAPKADEPPVAGADITETPEAKATREAAELAEKNKPVEMTDDQLREVLKGKGIELDDKGIDGLKEKLKPAPAATDPADVEKQKAAAEAAFEKRMVDYFLEKGGKVEDFANLKAVAGADLKSLSEAQIKIELKEADFTDDEIAIILKERYYQINPEELEQGAEETDEEFAARKKQVEKKIAYGSKKLESKSTHTKKQAEAALSALREAIKSQDEEREQEVKNSKGVEDFFTKFPKKVTFQLGKAEDGQELPPVEQEVPAEIIAEVQDTLKDPAKRNKILFNEDNSLNLDSVGNILIRNKILEAALAKTYISAKKQGSDEQVEIFEKLFPGRIAKDIGVGGANGKEGQGRKGHIVSRGAPEPVKRNT